MCHGIHCVKYISISEKVDGLLDMGIAVRALLVAPWVFHRSCQTFSILSAFPKLEEVFLSEPPAQSDVIKKVFVDLECLFLQIHTEVKGKDEERKGGKDGGREEGMKDESMYIWAVSDV